MRYRIIFLFVIIIFLAVSCVREKSTSFTKFNSEDVKDFFKGNNISILPFENHTKTDFAGWMATDILEQKLLKLGFYDSIGLKKIETDILSNGGKWGNNINKNFMFNQAKKLNTDIVFYGKIYDMEINGESYIGLNIEIYNVKKNKLVWIYDGVLTVLNRSVFFYDNSFLSKLLEQGIDRALFKLVKDIYPLFNETQISLINEIKKRIMTNDYKRIQPLIEKAKDLIEDKNKEKATNRRKKNKEQVETDIIEEKNLKKTEKITADDFFYLCQNLRNLYKLDNEIRVEYAKQLAKKNEKQ